MVTLYSTGISLKPAGSSTQQSVMPSTAPASRTRPPRRAAWAAPSTHRPAPSRFGRAGWAWRRTRAPVRDARLRRAGHAPPWNRHIPRTRSGATRGACGARRASGTERRCRSATEPLQQPVADEQPQSRLMGWQRREPGPPTDAGDGVPAPGADRVTTRPHRGDRTLTAG